MVVEWRSIPGYEGLYEVSSQGKVRNVRKCENRIKGRSRMLKPHIVKAPSNSVGYYSVKLSKTSKGKDFIVSRLVAMVFIPNPDNKPQVNHKDGNTLNNVVSNLEWATCAENHKHAYETGLKDPHQGLGGYGKFVFIHTIGLKFIGTPRQLHVDFPYEGDIYRIVTHEEECGGWKVDWYETAKIRASQNKAQCEPVNGATMGSKGPARRNVYNDI